MQLSKIRIKNYRLLINAELDVDKKTTLIVGRNNTAKTSCMECISTILNGNSFSYNDYPLTKRQELCNKILEFMEKKIKYNMLCEQLDIISAEFIIDYSLDDPEANLGALSPFIIDVDVDTTTAIVRAEYRVKIEEKALWDLFEKSCYDDNGNYSPVSHEIHSLISENFEKLFELTLYAVNPNDANDRQIKSKKEVSDLFPLYSIPAERVLGEDGNQNNSSLSSLIADFFDLSEDDLSPDIANEVRTLREIIEKANKDVQENSDKILSGLVNDAIGFGYPNSEELQLGVTTKLKIDEQIKKSNKALIYRWDK